MTIRRPRLVLILWGLVTAALSAAPSGGIGVGTSLFFPPQGTFTTPSIGAEYRARFDLGDSPFRLGFNLGAEVYFPAVVSNQTLTVLVGLPWQMNLFLNLTGKDGSFVFRPGIGLGPYISIKATKFGSATGGLVPWIQPQLELGVRLSGGAELLLIPAYNAFLDFLSPGGIYVHGLSVRLALQFAPVGKGS